jgi:sulfonate dioxygenase
MGKVSACFMYASVPTSRLTCRTFGRLHIHPTSGQPKEYPELHLVYHDEKSAGKLEYNQNKLTGTGWHSDVTYELQPPGLTTLFLYETPETGGDTAYVSQVGMSCIVSDPLHTAH